MKRILFIIILGLSLHLAFAQDEDAFDVRVKGFVDTYQAVQTDKPNKWMSSRTRVRGELTIEKNNIGAFVSANAIYNSIVKEQSGFSLREAYGYFSVGNWDIRAGRQIVTWGVADAMRLTDIISPMDFTEYLAQDYDDIRVPVTGIRVKYIKPSWAAEVIAIPVPSFFELPTDKTNPWAISFAGVNQPYLINLDNTPAKKLSNSEYGGRFSVFMPGVDFSVYALHTWNKMPVFAHTINEDGELVFIGEHRRMTMIGADASVPVGKFVLRGEFAEYLDEVQTPAKSSVMPPRRNTTNALLGIDFYPGNDWTLAVQYSHKYVSGFSSDISGYRNSGMATVKIGKDLLRNTLNLSTFAYVDVTNGGIYNRLVADYAITDQIHAFIGYDLFHANAGMFAMYSKNSEIWLKLKYSF